MKKSIIWLVGVLALGTMAYFSSKLWAKPAPPAQPAQTRIGLLNLRLVIKNYSRYQQFIEAIRKEEKNYLKALEAKQKLLEKLSKEAETLKGAALAAKEKENRTVQREMEDIKEQAKADVTTKSNDEMVKTYKIVRDAAARYAKDNNIDLLLTFEGAAEKDEVDSPMLITRNMNAGGTVPMYWNPSLDISGPVLDALNVEFKRIRK